VLFQFSLILRRVFQKKIFAYLIFGCENYGPSIKFGRFFSRRERCFFIKFWGKELRERFLCAGGEKKGFLGERNLMGVKSVNSRGIRDFSERFLEEKRGFSTK